MLVKTRKVLTVAVAVAALTTASLALAGDAFADGGRHGRHFSPGLGSETGVLPSAVRQKPLESRD